MDKCVANEVGGRSTAYGSNKDKPLHADELHFLAEASLATIRRTDEIANDIFKKL